MVSTVAKGEGEELKFITIKKTIEDSNSNFRNIKLIISTTKEYSICIIYKWQASFNKSSTAINHSQKAKAKPSQALKYHLHRCYYGSLTETLELIMKNTLIVKEIIYIHTYICVCVC
ncbi:hypothetical protein V6Z11_D01G163100 [Gossypium hirsutum]